MAKPDPLRSFYGHPILPAGHNSWEINGDEMDGAGVNEPIWPDLFDSFIALTPIVITPDMLSAFEEACPDLVIAGEEDVVMVKGGLKKATISPQTKTIVPVSGSTVVKVKGSYTVKIGGMG